MNDAGKRLIAAAKESARTALRAHRDDLEAERDALLLKNEEITAERDALRSQNDALMRERTSMIATHRGNLALAEKAHAAERDALRARVAELEARQTEADAAGFRRGVEAAAKVVEIDRNAYRLTGIVGVAEALTVAATAIRATLSEPRT